MPNVYIMKHDWIPDIIVTVSITSLHVLVCPNITRFNVTFSITSLNVLVWPNITRLNVTFSITSLNVLVWPNITMIKDVVNRYCFASMFFLNFRVQRSVQFVWQGWRWYHHNQGIGHSYEISWAKSNRGRTTRYDQWSWCWW